MASPPESPSSWLTGSLTYTRGRARASVSTPARTEFPAALLAVTTNCSLTYSIKLSWAAHRDRICPSSEKKTKRPPPPPPLLRICRSARARRGSRDTKETIINNYVYIYMHAYIKYPQVDCNLSARDNCWREGNGIRSDRRCINANHIRLSRHRVAWTLSSLQASNLRELRAAQITAQKERERERFATACSVFENVCHSLRHYLLITAKGINLAPHRIHTYVNG